MRTPCTIIAILLLATCGMLSAAQPFVEVGGVLSIEAEHFASSTPSTYSAYAQTHEWQVKKDIGGASGGSFVQILPDEWVDGQASGPSSPRGRQGAMLGYPIRISSAGTYHVFVRGYSMGGESNGVHVGVDGQLAGTEAGASNISGFRPHYQWVWEDTRKDGYVGTATLVLSAGDHVLNVWNRDDGFRCDKIVLRRTSGTPSGMGPAESARAASTPAAPVTPVPVTPVNGAGTVVAIDGSRILLDGKEIKLKGLRLSNALISDAEADELIANLSVFKGYGLNSFSVFVMGSRFGDIKGYRPDASLDPIYAARLARILKAADRERMLVLIGCLYWSTSKAKADLGGWTQADAENAVANTVRFVDGLGHRNVIFDPDNEGMAERATNWDIKRVIAAGHNANPDAIIGYNGNWSVPANADLTFHFGAKIPGKPWFESEGTPTNAPGGYWGTYSKQGGVYNYIRIGEYNESMKANQITATDREIAQRNGYFCASTWLQCVPPYGPNNEPGGDGSVANPGVRWWLEHVQATYGAYVPGEPTTPPTATVPRIDELRLVNATTGVDLGALRDGDVIDRSVSGDQLSVVAVTSNAGSVIFDLDQGTHVQRENNPPYALFGDSKGSYTAWTASLGTHRLVVTPYALDGATGAVGAARDIRFSVVAQGVGPGVTGAWLVDANTDQRLMPLGEFTTIDLAAVGNQLTIEVTATAGTGSLRIVLDQGAHEQIENNAPYSLFGDVAGDMAAGPLGAGSHVVTITPYAEANLGGAAGPSSSYAFTLIEAGLIAINFQPAAASVPGGHVVDAGAAFGPRGNGETYGWDVNNDRTRDRQVDSDQRRDTLNHLHHPQSASARTWELALPNGVYAVSLLCGDPAYTDQINTLLIENTVVSDPDGMDHFDQFDVLIAVDDGRLTITAAPGAYNPKLCAIEVTPMPTGTN